MILIGYHITTATAFDSIRRHGITPVVGERAAASGESPAQVYLFKSAQDAEAGLKSSMSDVFDKSETVVVLEIDLAGLEFTASGEDDDFDILVREVIPPGSIMRVLDENFISLPWSPPAPRRKHDFAVLNGDSEVQRLLKWQAKDSLGRIEDLNEQLELEKSRYNMLRRDLAIESFGLEIGGFYRHEYNGQIVEGILKKSAIPGEDVDSFFKLHSGLRAVQIDRIDRLERIEAPQESDTPQRMNRP